MNLFLLKGESSKPAVPPPRPALIKWARAHHKGWWEPFTWWNHRDKLLDVRFSLHSKKPEVQRRGSRGHSLAGDGSHADAPLGAGVLVVRDELDGAAAPPAGSGRCAAGWEASTHYHHHMTPHKRSQSLCTRPKTIDRAVTARFLMRSEWST